MLHRLHRKLRHRSAATTKYVGSMDPSLSFLCLREPSRLFGQCFQPFFCATFKPSVKQKLTQSPNSDIHSTDTWTVRCGCKYYRSFQLDGALLCVTWTETNVSPTRAVQRMMSGRDALIMWASAMQTVNYAPNLHLRVLIGRACISNYLLRFSITG